MGKAQRRKGAEYELEICALLRDILGREVRRNIGQSRDGGDDITIGPYRIECKRRAKIAVYEWLEQAEAAAKLGETPVVICRGDGKKSLAILDAVHFAKLMGNEL